MSADADDGGETDGRIDQKHGFGRHETPEARADRRWAEMLQEVRVTQTGAQILFGFLLSVAFTPRFTQLGGFDKALYATTVLLGALATGALVAPVSLHRMLAGHRRKPELVTMTGRLVVVGMTLLAAAVVCAVLLLLRVALGGGWAWGLAAAVLAWFAVCWLLLPTALRHYLDRPGT
ncbi:DUF6328 family protein [Streptomyces sp. PTM05]|uniref:DUF6328 family protein n=1 Tax=Streptantibioticus parmotrematis TaxID=2873249 RepID=A0ABS7QY32_9ACTN|nr:DUF6328 family protein [Streptantibioticus parmotrematis]MBY8887250.1 DUF6328 family protein [Streptantibioticus parmotrematis]